MEATDLKGHAAAAVLCRRRTRRRRARARQRKCRCRTQKSRRHSLSKPEKRGWAARGIVHDTTVYSTSVYSSAHNAQRGVMQRQLPPALSDGVLRSPDALLRLLISQVGAEFSITLRRQTP